MSSLFILTLSFHISYIQYPIPTNTKIRAGNKTLAAFAEAAKQLASDATKNPPGVVGGTLAPLKAQSGSGSSTSSSGSSSATATTGASASPSSAAGIMGVGWMTFAGAVGVAGLLGM